MCNISTIFFLISHIDGHENCTRDDDCYRGMQSSSTNRTINTSNRIMTILSKLIEMIIYSTYAKQTLANFCLTDAVVDDYLHIIAMLQSSATNFLLLALRL